MIQSYFFILQSLLRTIYWLHVFLVHSPLFLHFYHSSSITHSLPFPISLNENHDGVALLLLIIPIALCLVCAFLLTLTSTSSMSQTQIKVTDFPLLVIGTPLHESLL
jgi:energy-coupling factor transporter transmembrane protein EcfT